MHSLEDPGATVARVRDRIDARREWWHTALAYMTCGGSVIPIRLWVVYVILFLESVAWYSDSMSFIAFVSTEFGLDDVVAGFTYSRWGFGLSICAFIVGPLIDVVVFSRAIVCGVALSLVARLIIALNDDRSTTLWTYYTLYSFATMLIGPSIWIGTKRMIDDEEQGTSFTLQYTIENAGAFVGSLSVALFLIKDIPILSTLLPDGLRSLRLVNVFITFLCLLLATFVFALTSKTESELRYERQVFAERRNEARDRETTALQHKWYCPPWRWQRSCGGGGGACGWLYCAGGCGLLDGLRNVWRIITEKNFWRLIVFLMCLMGVRSIFKHLDATFPKYVTRTLGPDANYGLLLAIDPLGVLIVAPLVTTWFKKRPSLLYALIVIGTAVSAFSVLLLTLPASYGTVIAFMVMFSIGEAIYAPRISQYNLQMSSVGLEGMYATLINLPFFGMKILSGPMSGYLLDTYCPASGPRDCEFMWLLIGAMAISSAVLLMLFWPFLNRRTLSPFESGDTGVDASIPTERAPRNKRDDDVMLVPDGTHNASIKMHALNVEQHTVPMVLMRSETGRVIDQEDDNDTETKSLNLTEDNASLLDGWTTYDDTAMPVMMPTDDEFNLAVDKVHENAQSMSMTKGENNTTAITAATTSTDDDDDDDYNNWATPSRNATIPRFVGKESVKKQHQQHQNDAKSD